MVRGHVRGHVRGAGAGQAGFTPHICRCHLSCVDLGPTVYTQNHGPSYLGSMSFHKLFKHLKSKHELSITFVAQPTRYGDDELSKRR